MCPKMTCVCELTWNQKEPEALQKMVRDEAKWTGPSQEFQFPYSEARQKGFKETKKGLQSWNVRNEVTLVTSWPSPLCIPGEETGYSEIC
jgi:hypothetical protein